MTADDRFVVIDPEDREQVERLIRALPDALDWGFVSYAEPGSGVVDGITEVFQAALREFAKPTPPKPEEPTGDGALVECEYDGKQGRAVLLGGSWTFYGGHLRYHDRFPQLGQLLGRISWYELDAVTVLSEGVQP